MKDIVDLKDENASYPVLAPWNGLCYEDLMSRILFCLFSSKDLSAYVLKWRLRKCQIEACSHINLTSFLQFCILNYLLLSIWFNFRYMIHVYLLNRCCYNLLLTFTNVRCPTSLCLLLKLDWVIRRRNPGTFENR